MATQASCHGIQAHDEVRHKPFIVDTIKAATLAPHSWQSPSTRRENTSCNVYMNAAFGELCQSSIQNAVVLVVAMLNLSQSTV